MTTSPPNIENESELIAYLRAAGHMSADERAVVRVLAGGVSNKTVLVELPGRSWVIKQALGKLRVKVDWFASTERIEREALGMRWLAELAPAGTIVPLVALDNDNNILIMDAVPEPHENWKTMLLRGDIVPDHARQFGALLGTVQRKSRERLDEVAAAFADTSFFEQLRLEPFYAYTSTQVADTGFLANLIDATRERRFALVHGDYSPKNVLVRDDKLILLDHEVIHFGDPAFDVGFAMAHLLSKAHHLVEHRVQMLGAAATFWASYSDALGDSTWDPSLERFAVLHGLGCLLARVAGRSTLEYLSPIERANQQMAVLAIAANPPIFAPDLIAAFGERIDTNVND